MKKISILTRNESYKDIMTIKDVTSNIGNLIKFQNRYLLENFCLYIFKKNEDKNFEYANTPNFNSVEEICLFRREDNYKIAFINKRNIDMILSRFFKKI